MAGKGYICRLFLILGLICPSVSNAFLSAFLDTHEYVSELALGSIAETAPDMKEGFYYGILVNATDHYEHDCTAHDNDDKNMQGPADRWWDEALGIYRELQFSEA